MKCKYCDGTGEHINDANRMTTCEFCGGTGEFDPNEVDRFNAVDFVKVMEIVKKPLTNDEWRKICSAEEFAEWLKEVTEYCFECGLNINNGVLCPFGKCIDKEEDAVKWLKEKHHEMPKL